MGSSSSDYASVMGKNLGMMPNAGSPPPVVQQSQPAAQVQGATQPSPMNAMLQMFMNQMMGIKGGGQTQPQPTVSPRDALIQSLMGGGYGR